MFSYFSIYDEIFFVKEGHGPMPPLPPPLNTPVKKIYRIKPVNMKLMKFQTFSPSRYETLARLDVRSCISQPLIKTVTCHETMRQLFSISRQMSSASASLKLDFWVLLYMLSFPVVARTYK